MRSGKREREGRWCEGLDSWREHFLARWEGRGIGGRGKRGQQDPGAVHWLLHTPLCDKIAMGAGRGQQGRVSKLATGDNKSVQYAVRAGGVEDKRTKRTNRTYLRRGRGLTGKV
jgi:hypothetical protein